MMPTINNTTPSRKPKWYDGVENNNAKWPNS